MQEKQNKDTKRNLGVLIQFLTIKLMVVKDVQN